MTLPIRQAPNRPSDAARIIRKRPPSLESPSRGAAGVRRDLPARLACAPGWRIVVAPELRLSGGILVPDVAGWRPGRWTPASAGALDLPPDWVCEVRGARGEGPDPAERRARYAAQGIDWLWSVDRRARRLEAFAFFRGAWTLFATLAEGDVLRVAPFREIELPPAAVWTG